MFRLHLLSIIDYGCGSTSPSLRAVLQETPAPLPDRLFLVTLPPYLPSWIYVPCLLFVLTSLTIPQLPSFGQKGKGDRVEVRGDKQASPSLL